MIDMIPTIPLLDGATLAALLGGAGAVAKYGGSIVAIFARMEVFQKQQVEVSEKIYERLERIERSLAVSQTVETQNMKGVKMNGS